MTLSTRQTDQQDFVDNTIYEFLSDVAPEHYNQWDIETVGQIRDAVMDALKMTEKERHEFYPHV